MRLGVNIDHVATIRNARGGKHPNPLDAANIVEKAGADLIVVHLREDRRHIRENDIDNILKNIKIPLQLEIAPTLEMFEFSIKKNIKKICIVPEKRQEITTEGGLDIKKNYDFLSKHLNKLFEKNIEVSLFIDPNNNSVELSKKLGINAIELHTGCFANASSKKEKMELDKIIKTTDYAKNENLSVRAGHGLTYDKVKEILKVKNIEELNIGHFLIGEAIFDGLEKVVKKMKYLIKNGKFL